jgi:hypothetical protein
VGGNTKFYGAALFRLRREDFGEIKHWDGLSPAWHWQTTLVSEDTEAVARGIRGRPCAMLSPGIVAKAERALGFAKGL